MNKTKLCVSDLTGSRTYKFVGVKLCSHFYLTKSKFLRTRALLGYSNANSYRFHKPRLCISVSTKPSSARYKNEVLVNGLDQIGPTQIRRPGKKHHKKLFIREISAKSKTLYFAKHVATLVKCGSYTIKRGVGVYDLRYQSFVIPKLGIQNNKNFVFVPSFGKNKVAGGSLFSLDSNLNQLLFASNHFYRLSSHRKLGYLYATNLNKMSFLSSDLANLGLSIKTYLFLKQKGIHKIGSLVPYFSKDLLQLLNKDKDMFAEVRRCSLLLAIHGNA